MGHDTRRGHKTPHIAPAAETPRKSSGADRQGQGPSASVSPQITRTSGSDEQSCRLCGAEIKGRRSNGFCSDRCRMHVKRQERAQRISMAFKDAEEAVDSLLKALRLISSDNGEQ